MDVRTRCAAPVTSCPPPPQRAVAGAKGVGAHQIYEAIPWPLLRNPPLPIPPHTPSSLQVGRVGRADRMGLAVSIAATAKEKVRRALRTARRRAPPAGGPCPRAVDWKGLEATGVPV